MKFSLISCLISLASGAVIQQRGSGDCATVSPFLAPACNATGIATNLLCPFPDLSLRAGICQDVTYDCPVHPPTSFVAKLNQPTSSRCYIAVFPDFGCKGSEVDSGVLGTEKCGCIEAPYFGKVLTGGILSSSLLPFGFKSVKLVCA